MSRAALQHTPQSARDGARAATPLRVGPAHDAFEREADEAAEQVVAGRTQRAAWSLSRVGFGPLQRECSCGGACEECKKTDVLQRQATSATAGGGHAPASVERVLLGAGQPLDRATRSFMEQRFGCDFGSVRIFNDSAAAASARAVSAHAYTVGDKVVFDAGRYQPHSPAGGRLLAHEFAHVVQQQSPSRSSAAILTVGGHSDAHELAANRAAHAAVQDSSATEGGQGAAALAQAGPLQRPVVQRLSYAEIKESAYKGLVNAARKTTQASLSLLRSLASHLPANMQSGASTMIDIADVVIGAVFAVVLAVIGIIVGAGEGVADMVKGLVTLVLGVGKVLFDVISGFFTNFDAAKQDWNAIVEIFKGLPSAVKALVTDWLDRFQKASSERQSLMIGELTGQIIALIGTFAVSAGRAGTAAKIGSEGADISAGVTKAASKLGEVGDVAGSGGKVADAGTAAAKARPALRAIEGGGQGATEASAGTLGTKGSLALAPEAEQAPKFTPYLVPPPVLVPAPPVPVPTPIVAPAAQAATKGASKVASAAGKALAVGKAVDIAKPKKKKPCAEAEPVDPLPIVWPVDQLPLPNPELVRTKGDLREVLGTDRGPNQEKFAACIRQWRRDPRGMDLEHSCPGRGYYQEGLLPSENIDAHHIEPLYLGGGDDWEGNLSAIEVMRHREGHRLLDNQKEMFDHDPTWLMNNVCSPRLSEHPIDQEYYIASI